MSMTNNPITHIPKFQSKYIAEELWEIVELARQDFDQCIEVIKSLDRKSLIRLYWNYISVQANFLYEPYRIEDYSDGLNDDIGHWIVKQGKEFCNRVLNDPRLVPRLEDLDGNFHAGPRIVSQISNVYEERYNRRVPHVDDYKDEFWDIIDLGIESIKKLVETVNNLSREELLEFIHIYENAMKKFEKGFIRSLSRHNIDIKNLDYSVRDISKWVVAQGRKDFCDYEENILKDYHVPVDLSDPKMTILDVLVQECEKRYYNYPSDEFWKIIILIQQNFNQFSKEVEQMRREEFIQFANDLYSKAIPTLNDSVKVYYQDLDFNIAEIEYWVIAQGREFYAKIIANSNSIPKNKIEEIEDSHPEIKLLYKAIEVIYAEYENRYDEGLEYEIE